VSKGAGARLLTAAGGVPEGVAGERGREPAVPLRDARPDRVVAGRGEWHCEHHLTAGAGRGLPEDDDPPRAAGAEQQQHLRSRAGTIKDSRIFHIP
jgi:hypothetical protein